MSDTPPTTFQQFSKDEITRNVDYLTNNNNNNSIIDKNIILNNNNSNNSYDSNNL